MFFRTMNLTKFKNNPSDPLGEIEKDKVLQLLHGGHEVKVVMTQDHYFGLLSQIEDLKNALTLARGEPLEGDPHVPYGTMKENMRSRIKARREKDGYHDGENSVGTRQKAAVRGSA